MPPRIALPLDGVEQRLERFVIHQRFFLGADERARAVFGAGLEMEGFDQQEAVAVLDFGHGGFSKMDIPALSRYEASHTNTVIPACAGMTGRGILCEAIMSSMENSVTPLFA